MAAVIDSVVQVLLVGVLIPLTAVLICYQQPYPHIGLGSITHQS